MNILVASRNPGKLREYKDLLADLTAADEPITWLLLTDAGIDSEVAETGDTFEANARLKATTYARQSGLLTLADDSGLEVDALDGEPGVRSARYGGPQATDEDRYRKLLRALDSVPADKRSARFKCVVAVSTSEGTTITAEGTCEGRIAFEPRGTHGFGYDPVFYFPERGQTMAELTPDVKNQISHRAHALAAIKPMLAELLTRWGNS